MGAYSNSLKVKDALNQYFSQYHFQDGGYHLKWFKIKLGPLYFPLPNIKARVDAVKIHDIHHLVTEYDANMKGEVEIGGWEIASGCGHYYVAWILNFGSFFYGMLFHPRTLLKAFLRGRRSATNLYYNVVYDDRLLNRTVGELRETIDGDASKRNSVNDYLLFVLCCLVPLSIIVVLIYIFFLLINYFL